MKAFVLNEHSFGLEDVPDPQCAQDSSLVRVLCTALNHRDQFIREGLYSQIKLPAILGSDICGMAPVSAGERIIVDPSLNWGDNPRAQGAKYQPIGMPSQGGLAEYVCVPTSNVHPAPSHLTDEHAAALPLAGVTAYRALFTRAGLQPTDTVLITGIGGGVALMAMQFAIAHGARVVVSSRSQEKIDAALEHGAEQGFIYPFSEADMRRLKALGIDLIVDSIGGDTINELMDVAVPGGRIALFGSTLGIANKVLLRRIFWKQLSLLGSTMGTPKDFSDMLTFVTNHKIVPIVDSVFDFINTVQAFNKLKEHRQFGKIVVRVAKG